MSWPINASDVRKALGYTESQGDEDDLQLYADAAVEWVEEEIGPCSGQLFTSTLSGPADTILLDRRFATVQIEIDGVVVAWTGSLDSGLIRGSFAGSVITVRGVAPDTAPRLVEIATRELAAIWYRQANSGAAGRGPGRTAAVGPWQPMGFAVPREIDEKIEPFRALQFAGIA